MFERKETKISATTNDIESFKEYLHYDIQRFNTFWASLHRLVDLTMHKTIIESATGLVSRVCVDEEIREANVGLL
jgi:hypothetical protein